MQDLKIMFSKDFIKQQKNLNLKTSFEFQKLFSFTLCVFSEFNNLPFLLVNDKKVLLRSLHNLFNPTGSKDADWSVPFHALSSVKCLSIYLAPSVYAAISIAIPRWCPEKAISPTTFPYCF